MSSILFKYYALHTTAENKGMRALHTIKFNFREGKPLKYFHIYSVIVFT